MKIIKIVLPLIILITAFFLYKGIADPIAFNKERKVVYAKVIQNLKDIRTAQVAFRSVYDDYAPTFDSLEKFLQYDSLLYVVKIGDPEDSTSVVTIDTNYISVYDSLVEGNYALDSLKFAPYSGAKFSMETGKVNKGGVTVPVFQVKDTKPFDPEKPLQVGSLTDGSTAGNWE
ncbi:MAG: hypothetical protein ACJAZ3_000959 [Sphingobacteriales bacterium]|jgi:hypothetical protein